MPSKKKAPIKVCPAKIVYIIEYNDGWDDDEYWVKSEDIPICTRLLKSGKVPAGTRWEPNDRPFRRKEGAQYVLDAIHKTWPGEADRYRIAEVVCR